MPDISQDNFSVINYLKIFFRRKELILIPAFLGLIAGICAGMVMPKKYISTSVMLVEEGKTDNPLFSNLAVSTTVRQRLVTIRESMLGWNSMTQLVDRLKLDKGVSTTKEYENLILEIRNNILIKLRGNNIIEVSYIGDNPNETKAIVENIGDIFIERNKQIQDQETQDAIAFIEKQLKVYKGKIKSAEIARLQDNLDGLLIDSTERHPMVKQLREQIAQKKAELAEENLPYTEPDRLEKESTNPLIESIQSALDKLEKTSPVAEASGDPGAEGLYKVLLMERLGNVVARDAKVNEQIYNMLLQRMETARITRELQASKEGTRYTVLDPPRIPLEPFKPNRLLVAFVGLLGGIGFGFGLVFLSEFMDKSFIDVEEAKEYLGVPLLGAISKITTVEAVAQERERKRWVYFLTFATGIVCVVITATVSNFIK